MKIKRYTSKKTDLMIMKITIFVPNLISMKKFFGLLFLVFALQSCDDGDFTIEDSFDFSAVTGRSCNASESGFFVYKINRNEALLLQIPESNFKNESTPEGQPRIITLGGNNKVIYRLFNGELSTNNICSAILPATPIITEEWNAVSGTVEIISIANKTLNTTTNATTITGYTHTITFKNIQFELGNGNIQLYDQLSFGTYVTNESSFADFTSIPIARCQNNNQLLYKISNSQSLNLEINPELFNATVGTNTVLLDAITKLSHLKYNGTLSGTFFCSSPLPSTPVLQQTWIANQGIFNESGMLEITTTEILDLENNIIGYNYKFKLLGVTMSKGIEFFYLGDSYDFGEINIGI
jgi:hypothetical protein